LGILGYFSTTGVELNGLVGVQPKIVSFYALLLCNICSKKIKLEF